VDELTPTDHDLAVFGGRWTPDLLDPRYLRGDGIPNEELATYYSAADIVLNDHWSDMAEQGFISNRLYDAAASGAFVISDNVEGIAEEFDGGVVTFETGEELRALIERYLADPGARAAHAARARAAVLARHTFDDRAGVLAAAIEAGLEARRTKIIEPEPDAIEPAGAVAEVANA
jgi:spore maturation protein CgeB